VKQEISSLKAAVVEDTKELLRKFWALRTAQRVGVVVCCLLALGFPPWWSYMSARWTTEMQYLYGSAAVGDPESVREISSHRIWGTSWLEKLARDRYAFAESRAAAIDELANKSFVNRRRLVPLLWIEEPFVVRHEAALMFRKIGCNDDCVGMVLRCLHSMQTGRPMLEGQPPAKQNDDYILQLRATSKQDYLNLLNTNPCMSRRTLRSDYPADSSFIADTEKSLPACPSPGGSLEQFRK
jgi:hypothetical protein